MEPAENFYELLEVESTASFEEVQQAYEKKPVSYTHLTLPTT